jgi:hypothetical protein
MKEYWIITVKAHMSMPMVLPKYLPEKEMEERRNGYRPTSAQGKNEGERDISARNPAQG